VSQYNSLTIFDKGKALGLARDRMMWSREEMARALHLDPLYLAQLEDGRRKVDAFYVQRAEELVRAFEKTNH
jgi:transcriptional regulator with XRE-family HTH domain